MKTLFNKDERYVDEANTLDREIYTVLGPIFNKWIDYGYKVREIEYIAQKICTDLALDQILWPRKTKDVDSKQKNG